MSLFQKKLSEHIRFASHFLALIAVVGLGRLGLSLLGQPDGLVRWLSMTVVVYLALVVLAVRVHTTGFGAYRDLLVLLFLVSVTANVISALGVTIAIVTGVDNIFSVPEFSPGRDGKTVFHAAAHLVLGMTVFPLALWIVGSAILFATRRLTRLGVARPSGHAGAQQ